MTGYARAERSESWGRLSWELRSVNHRYLDLQFKLPDEMRVLESELRASMTGKVSRGKVECGLRIVRERGESDSISVSVSRLEELKSALATVEDQFGSLPAADSLRVLGFPGVLQQTEQDNTPILAAARQLFAEAVADFTETRAREGARTTELLKVRCMAISELVTRVQQRYAEVRSQWQQKMRNRAAELAVELDPARLEQELVLALQRLDVDEELTRLESHLQEVRDTLDRDEPVGRRLDFLMQELNREANTLSSKSQDAEMTRCAVDIKVLIEQMREQVQNIE